MNLTLTAEQLEKAAEAAKRTFYGPVANGWINAMVAAAPHLQAQPQQVSGGLLQRRCQQAREALGHGAGLVDEIQLVAIVSEVMRRDAEELLAEPTPEEKEQMGRDWDEHDTATMRGWDNYHHCTAKLIERRRARLFAPPVDPEERVTVEHCLVNPDRWIVLLDGANPASTYFGSEKDADIYRTGLIAQLRADATLKEKEQR